MRNNFEKFEQEYNKIKDYSIILEYGENLEKPDIKDFEEIYSPEKIERDLSYLNLIKNELIMKTINWAQQKEKL